MTIEGRARREALFREVNERILELSNLHGTAEFLCECDRGECMTAFAIDVAAYANVREFEFRFLVVPEHVDPEVEVVVARGDRYAVVEKIGAAAQAVEQVAVELDSDA